MTRDEFIQSFKEKVVNGVYYNMPKDYRKSEKYSNMTFEEQYEQALSHSTISQVLEEIISDYYDSYISEDDDCLYMK